MLAAERLEVLRDGLATVDLRKDVVYLKRHPGRAADLAPVSVLSQDLRLECRVDRDLARLASFWFAHLRTTKYPVRPFEF